jgi:L-rhamnose mutarotase
MERILMYIRIFPGTEADYDKKHAEIWPELVAEIQESGIRNFTGFRRGTDVWYYGECHPDVATAFGVHGPKPYNTKWNHFFRGIIAEIADEQGALLSYKQIFHTTGPALDGPMQRGCFSLVVDPERVADYERLHANPWPDMIQAIEDAGFRNYGGFRRGPHVVYYGEFYPDMDTVFAKIGKTDVNRRWGEAFEGIILTITDPEGNLLVANEMHHND